MEYGTVLTRSLVLTGHEVHGINQPDCQLIEWLRPIHTMTREFLVCASRYVFGNVAGPSGNQIYSPAPTYYIFDK